METFQQNIVYYLIYVISMVITWRNQIFLQKWIAKIIVM